jgi:hypothetical protein
MESNGEPRARVIARLFRTLEALETEAQGPNSIHARKTVLNSGRHPAHFLGPLTVLAHQFHLRRVPPATAAFYRERFALLFNQLRMGENTFAPFDADEYIQFILTYFGPDGDVPPMRSR